MVRNVNLFDPMNERNERNIRNTNKCTYNCAGYALGTYSWYCPHTETANEDGESGTTCYRFRSSSEAEKKTTTCIEVMLADFPSMRVIASVNELAHDEYAILFRLSHDGDFHFLKRGRNGVWYGKNGGERHCSPFKGNIWSKWNWRYDGPIVIFAKKFVETY